MNAFQYDFLRTHHHENSISRPPHPKPVDLPVTCLHNRWAFSPDLMLNQCTKRIFNNNITFGTLSIVRLHMQLVIQLAASGFFGWMLDGTHLFYLLKLVAEACRQIWFDGIYGINKNLLKRYSTFESTLSFVICHFTKIFCTWIWLIKPGSKHLIAQCFFQLMLTNAVLLIGHCLEINQC